MDAARQAVSSHVNRDGVQRTDVDEVVAPAVVQETVMPQRYVETQEAVDREIHQDHYHTTVQPLAQQERLPETHVHQVAPQIERTFEHGNREEDRARHLAELEQFRNTSTTLATETSAAVAPAVAGEHTHHHVHEIVQPIIHKETIQPEVVHTTVPIHEKVTAPSEMHGISQLPVKTLDEFQAMGTSLSGGHMAHTEYDGHPHKYDPSMQLEQTDVDLHPERHEGIHDPTRTHQPDQYLHHHHHGAEAGGAALGAGAAIGAASHHHGDQSMSTGSGIGGYGNTGSGVGGYDNTTGQVPYGNTGSGVGGYDNTTGQAPYGGTGFEQSNSGGQTAPGYNTRGTEQYGSQSGFPSSGAMGAGVAGVGAGEVARDLGRDHTRAHEVSDLDPRDTTSRDMRSTGTALGGRTEGNMATGAGSELRDEFSPKDQHGGLVDRSREPSNLVGGDAEPRRETSHQGQESSRQDFDDDKQHASQMGEDPSLTTKGGGKLTGTGVDGSHSAVFGLTPDGHKHNDTKHGQDTSQLRHDEKEKKNKTAGDGDDTEPSQVGTGSGTGEGELAGQMRDPRMEEKGHDGKASYTDSDSKPGMGGSMTANPLDTPSNA